MAFLVWFYLYLQKWRYRKQLPIEYSAPGHECPFADGPKGSKISIIICGDGDYPEFWREAAASGANIIIRVSHYMAPWDQAWEITNKAGAYFNQCYVIGALIGPLLLTSALNVDLNDFTEALPAFFCIFMMPSSSDPTFHIPKGKPAILG